MKPQLNSINGEEGSKRKRESLPLVNLELGIGCSGGSSRVIQEEEDKQVVFTAEQFQEFHLQVIIFRYIFSGLPVPIHLVLPVWKSVDSSSRSSKSGINGQFPSFLGFTIRHIEYRRMMDSEPGRCRRTDGKKWRCYRNVVPHQKYCERHMHRGCQRSRKHVEISEDTSKSNTLSMNSNKFASAVISSSAASTDSKISASISTGLSLTVSCSNASVPENSEGGSESYTHNGNWENNGISSTTTASLVRLLADKDNTKYENYTAGKGLNFNHTHTNKNDWSTLGNKNYCDASVAPRFCLSPKSVLQGAAGCNRLNFGSKTLAETEPLRCRRTDGKKWRCSRDVIPDKKYCETHIHRGAKKARLDSKLVTSTPAEPSSCSIEARCASTKVDNIINLNANLSITMAACPQKTSYIDSTTFSSSDATTTTDENGSIARIPTVSP